MSISNGKLPRRQILRLGLICGAAVMSGVGMLLSKGVSAAGLENKIIASFRVLIDALRSTNNAACLRASNKIEVAWASNTEVNLHLRNANLKAAEAEIIAGALHEASLYGGLALNSFSMSYNPGLTDAGVVALAKALPRSLTEVGFVECDIGDDGGAALLRFSQHTAGLRMICLEGNRFSESIKHSFTILSQERANLLVIV